MTEAEAVALLGPAAIAAGDELVAAAPALSEQDRAELALLLRRRPTSGSTASPAASPAQPNIGSTPTTEEAA